MGRQDVAALGPKQTRAFTRALLRDLQVLEGLDRETFTTEMTQFNLEINAPPLRLEAGCFSAAEQHLNQLMAEVRASAQTHDAEVVLMGILPTIMRSDLSLDNLTPLDR